jgi:hypothetical protein
MFQARRLWPALRFVAARCSLSSRSDRSKRYRKWTQSFTAKRPKGLNKQERDAIWQDMWRDRLILPRLRGAVFKQNEGKPIVYLGLSYRAKANFNFLWSTDKTPVDPPEPTYLPMHPAAEPVYLPLNTAADAEPAAPADTETAAAGKD